MLAESSSRSRSGFQSLYLALGLLVGVGLGVLVVGVPDSLKLVVIIIGAFAFAASIYRVQWGLLVLVFISYLNLSDIAISYYGAPSITKLFSVLLLFGLILRWLFYGERPTNWAAYTILVGGYALAGLVSIFFAADQMVAELALVDFLKDGILSIMIVLLLKSNVDLRRVVWTLLIVGIILGTLSIIQYVTGSFDYEFGGLAQTPDYRTITGSSVVENRATGPIGDPNVYAQIMLVMIPLALDRVWNEKSRRLRLLAIWSLVASVLAVILTFSRGAFVAFVIMGVAIIFIYRPRVVPLLITLAFGIVALRFLPTTYIDRMESLFSFLPWSTANAQADTSFRGRTSELLVGWMMFKDYPLTGVGLDNYPILYQGYSRQIGLDPRLQPRSAHNLYLEVASETGLFGISVFVIILYMMVRGLFKAWRIFSLIEDQERAGMVIAVGLGLLGYFTASLFIHAAYPRYLWLLIGIGHALYYVAKDASIIEGSSQGG